MRGLTYRLVSLQNDCVQEEGDGIGVPLALEDERLPLGEVLRCAGVPWSVSRRFCTELEASREALHINWKDARSICPQRLIALLSRLPRLLSLDGSPPLRFTGVDAAGRTL